MVTDSTGAYLSNPHVEPWAPFKAFCSLFPFMIIGGMISKHGAQFLEENDIFSPEDDDDDDDDDD